MCLLYSYLDSTVVLFACLSWYSLTHWSRQFKEIKEEDPSHQENTQSTLGLRDFMEIAQLCGVSPLCQCVSHVGGRSTQIALCSSPFGTRTLLRRTISSAEHPSRCASMPQNVVYCLVSGLVLPHLITILFEADYSRLLHAYTPHSCRSCCLPRLALMAGLSSLIQRRAT